MRRPAPHRMGARIAGGDIIAGAMQVTRQERTDAETLARRAPAPNGLFVISKCAFVQSETTRRATSRMRAARRARGVVKEKFLSRSTVFGGALSVRAAIIAKTCRRRPW